MSGPDTEGSHGWNGMGFTRGAAGKMQRIIIKVLVHEKKSCQCAPWCTVNDQFNAHSQTNLT